MGRQMALKVDLSLLRHYTYCCTGLLCVQLKGWAEEEGGAQVCRASQEDRGSATLGPKEGGVAGSRRPKAGSGPRPQCFSWCLSLPDTPAQPGDSGGPREGGLRPLAGAGDDNTGRPRGRGRRLAQSPSDLDGLRSILFPGEGNLLLPFLSSPSLPPLPFPPLCLRGALRSRCFPKPQSLSRPMPRPRGHKGLRAWFWGRPALPFFLQGTKGRSASLPFPACRRSRGAV
ncbi:uncharacterized protein LOC122690329 [Cervus elaphus]|uniref:uncharacterized protein LOC122690329 n=1 Tax=Cervus elaphus TaxID=9860 RepID=UPI001CC2D42B|nr:uncharacterized protein LOC122690329 [Cervus elaphus]